MRIFLIEELENSNKIFGGLLREGGGLKESMRVFVRGISSLGMGRLKRGGFGNGRFWFLLREFGCKRKSV